MTLIRQQYAKLTALGGRTGLACYSSQCNASKITQPQPFVSTCYSPLCMQKARVRRDLLLLLRKANSQGNNNNLSAIGSLNKSHLGNVSPKVNLKSIAVSSSIQSKGIIIFI